MRDIYMWGIFLICIFLLTVSSCKQTDETKLEELSQILIDNKDVEKIPQYIQNIKDGAQRQQNDRYLGTAHYYIALYYNQPDNIFSVNPINIDNDSIMYNLQLARNYYKKAGYERGELLVDQQIIGGLIKNNSYNLALNKIILLAKKAEALKDYYVLIMSDIYLAELYLSRDKPDRTLAILDTASVRSNKYLEGEEKKSIDINILIFKINAAFWNGDYMLSLSYIDSLQNLIDSSKLPDQTVNFINWWSLDSPRAENYIKLNKIEEAKSIINKMSLSIGEDYDKRGREHYMNSLLSKYYYKIHNYDRAYQYIDKFDPSVLEECGLSTPRDQERLLKIDILEAKGEHKKALSMMKEYYQYTDSLNRTDIARQINEAESLLKIEFLTTDSERKQKEYKTRHMQILLFSSLIVFFLIIVISVQKYNSKQLRKKNEKIFAQYQDLDRYREEMKTLNSSVNENKQADSISKDQSLFEKIENYLIETHCYREPNITRESLASELGTNRQYLTQAIQNNVNMTFSEYINFYRLEYSRELLTSPDNYTIEYIHISAGFLNKSTFYRLFKEKYGMTPKEFRDIAK